MKTQSKVLLIFMLVIMLSLDGCGGRAAGETVTLSGAFALYPLAVRWQEEYARVNPTVAIEVAAGGAGKGMTDVLGGFVDMAMVSRSLHQAEIDQGARGFAVAKDAVVCVINSLNPSASLLRTRGLTKQEAASIWISGSVKTWSGLEGLTDTGVINVYTRADACGAAEVWALYLGGKAQDALGGVQVSGDPGLAEAVVRDPLGIGFNNVNFAYDPASLQPVEGLTVLALDVNANGRVDREEANTATRTDVVEAIRDGRYPTPPARNLFFVTKGEPAKKAVRDFLIWTLTSGQRFIEESGYIQVTDEEIASCLNMLRAE